MNCSVCHQELAEGQRVSYNKKETFIFKPANVPDTVNPAKVSQEELLESRKEHTRTAVATVYVDYGKVPVPEFAFGIRHAACEVSHTGAVALGTHARTKHQIRYSRVIGRRMH